MATQRTQLGTQGEQLVGTFLEKKGYAILNKNYASRWGEVDIIAKQGDVICFIEVKTRKQSYFPIASVVNKGKQHKIIRTAKHFILNQQLRDYIFRFDVATVLLNDSKNPSINYIANAFTE